jgi:hypothetical protein
MDMSMDDAQRGKNGVDQSFASAPWSENDLAAMARSALFVGSTPLHQIEPLNARPMWTRFEEDGVVCNRVYRTNAMWKARVRAALTEGRVIRALEFDEWGRLQSLFPTEVRARLNWNAAQFGEVKPVARLYDPSGHVEMLLLRSRFCGHGVDVIHNLAEGGVMQQPLWVADIMRLAPLLDIKLVWDETFGD